MIAQFKQYMHEEQKQLTKQHDLEDLFRECIPEDACGHCPACCQEERGYQP